MIQFRSTPYEGVPFGQLIPPVYTSASQQTSTGPAPTATTGQGGAAPPASGDPSFPEWYKRPSVIIGGVVGLVALGALGWWAFK